MRYPGILFGAFISSALLAACGGTHGFSSPTSVLPAEGARGERGLSSNETVLYSFQGGSDGERPGSALLYVKKNLYGTTVFGGGSSCNTYGSPPGCGTAFKIKPGGSGYKVIYTWAASALDGAFPNGLIYAGNRLYSTTTWGGGAGCSTQNGCGTVFSLALKGEPYTILHSFTRGPDGGYVPGGVINVAGKLYGATNAGGGSTDCGVLYSLKLNHTNTLKSLHDFSGGTDGCGPGFAPVYAPETHALYGTTDWGGGGTLCSYYIPGCGTIYRFDLHGKSSNNYSLVYAFQGGMDGWSPGAMIDVNGTLYGTTNSGGGYGCGGGGCGTIFKIGTSGGSAAYSILHAFQGGADGAYPNGLLYLNGELYGTTTFGGGTSSCNNSAVTGCGVVFKLSTSGSGYTILSNFRGGMDGANPNAGLTDADGSLFGTTFFGGGYGCSGNGCGTIFKLSYSR